MVNRMLFIRNGGQVSKLLFKSMNVCTCGYNKYYVIRTLKLQIALQTTF